MDYNRCWPKHATIPRGWRRKKGQSTGSLAVSHETCPHDDQDISRCPFFPSYYPFQSHVPSLWAIHAITLVDTRTMTAIPLSVNPKGRAIIIVLGVFLALDFLFVLARYWARHIKGRSLEFNDWAMFSALISVTALYFTEVAAVRNGGVGLHVMEIVMQWGGMETVMTAGKLVLTADILWNVATLTIKMSILHLYISIFGLTSPKFCRLVWGVMGFCVISTIVFVVQILVLCRPLAFFWDKTIAGKCGSLPLTYLIPGIIITVEDIVTFALPMQLLWNLRMKTGKKLGAIFIFGIGFGICLMSGVRLKYVIELDTQDFTASIWQFAILGTLEPMLGIISACMPVIPSIIAHYSDHRVMAWSQKGVSSGGTKTFKSGKNASGHSSSLSHEEHAEFERLSDHEYPLIDQAKPTMGTQTRAVGDWSTAGSDRVDIEQGAIKVTRQYTVNS
ncbi:hypothetical protein BU24DRAFT_429151 [Aaosphaeria arxii CBS 175.79]|uniref:Rhodopsin domain-containing protein n=1 Tax=Aaosphaeria arxii CBS 175.79 TaxID=1450172 RepID=A0A6A5X7J5_9PLEO|nr:uncharacterized protein BU24DRAFT_429151 [Aaosphaeria arxii CBS 175.79]KAF2008891.1 hypothetical protein BU24DRAFT_429151 [Aaosphaeria arxii CBS 175.79]